ncbi:MAG: addiction module protein [Alphaproteobacteria bacterium]|nr:addiction module protein [Alphaproteobacteria bacterium]
MTRSELVAELMKLDPEERRLAAEELWDSVASDVDVSHEFSEEELAEIERRIEEHERDPSTAIPWETVRARLLAKYG